MMLPDICIGRMQIHDAHIQVKELKAGMVRGFGTCVKRSSRADPKQFWQYQRCLCTLQDKHLPMKAVGQSCIW